MHLYVIKNVFSYVPISKIKMPNNNYLISINIKFELKI